MEAIPVGYCQCGCGQKTNIPLHDYKNFGYIAGVPMRFVSGHNPKPRRELNGNWKGGKSITRNGYIRVLFPEHPYADGLGYVMEHRLVVEKALGKPLPKESETHHVNFNKHDNRNTNLVLCDSHAYHLWIHQRTKAYLACGNANWLKCGYCFKYDDPNNMYTRKPKNGYSVSAYHRKCRASHLTNYRRLQKMHSHLS